MPDSFGIGQLGEGRVVREGPDLPIVATGVEVQRAEEAAGQLQENGVSVEVIDPRTLKPLDLPLILDSVERTGRVLVVQESVKFGGFAGEIAASIAESRVFGHLQAPIRRLAGMDIPIPYNPQLEKAAVPQVEDIVREATALVKEW